jgi:poly(3-hydroxybutyrate) depolymerase
MASVMLATYPETFAAGAIIAGVPYGCARDVREAFDCMGGRARAQAAELAAKVRTASPHKGPWPRIQVWHGSADAIVTPGNGDAVALQWAHVHGLAPRPDREDRVGGYPRRIWTGADGTALIEHVSITGMAHGIPLDPGTGAGESGQAGAHMLDVGLSSTDRIAAFFGIGPEVAEKRARAEPRAANDPRPARARAGARPEPAGGVGAVIEQALRAAGLMR